MNHERWLVSYADFITLLFAFFVVMFAVSQVDSKKVGRFTESFNKALDWQVMQQPGPGSPTKGDPIEIIPIQGTPRAGGKGRASFEAEKEAIRQNITRRMGQSPTLSGLKILDVRGELVLRLPETLVFDRGEAILKPEGRVALDAIADELRVRPVRMRVEGHTDSAPIHTARFPSNWELSMARAMAVVAFLLDNGKIPPPKLAAAGYGEHHPIIGNDTPEGRTQNRRVDLIVVADFDESEGAGEAPTSGESRETKP